MHEPGNIYKFYGSLGDADLFMLTCNHRGDFSEWSLIALERGIAWEEPVQFPPHTPSLSDEEFGRVTDCTNLGYFVRTKDDFKGSQIYTGSDAIEITFVMVPQEVMYTECRLRLGKTVRIGIARCSESDKFDFLTGEKLALRRAIDQFNLTRRARVCLWWQYLADREIRPLYGIDQFIIQQFLQHVEACSRK